MSIRATIVAVGLATGLCVPAMADEREQSWLDAHNAARAEFGSAPLRWSDELERDAAVWANVLARTETMRHSLVQERRGRGENLWMGTAGYFEASQMIAHFVDEKQYFRPGRFPEVSRTGNWGDVGHYTQIVWADTREVGCATARSPRYEYLVCRYWPAGNVLGQVIEPERQMAQR